MEIYLNQENAAENLKGKAENDGLKKELNESKESEETLHNLWIKNDKKNEYELTVGSGVGLHDFLPIVVGHERLIVVLIFGVVTLGWR